MTSQLIRKTLWRSISVLVAVFIIAGSMCACDREAAETVPHAAAWGIYELDLKTRAVRLVYSSPVEIQASALRVSPDGTRFAFAAVTASAGNLDIYTVGIDGQGLVRLTDSPFDDLYPVWSPDGKRIAFLSQRTADMDIFMIDVWGGNEFLFHDSGFHDADIDWSGETIVFTSQFAIWSIRDNGTGPLQLTDFPRRGEWGSANLPCGDYDPRLSPDGYRIVFERLEDTEVPNGGYNLFLVNTGGTGEQRLTDNSCSQGLANWSHAGDRLVYVVAAADGMGLYDIWMMNADGTDNRDVTPGYFPPGFLCHSPVFPPDDTCLFFIGQWWE